MYSRLAHDERLEASERMAYKNKAKQLKEKEE
jgi:hypothetical protein